MAEKLLKKKQRKVAPVGRWGHRALPGVDESAMPTRRRLDHRGPLSIDVSSAWYFITICAEGHRTWVGRDDLIAPFDPFAALLSTARHFQKIGKWRLALFLVMPDHVHFIVNISGIGAMGSSRPTGLESVIRDFKRSVSRLFGIHFQRGFFDTRIRDDTHYAEKFRYICNNPVRKGFVLQRATGGMSSHLIAIRG